jgi:hypothetical protein
VSTDDWTVVPVNLVAIEVDQSADIFLHSVTAQGVPPVGESETHTSIYFVDGFGWVDPDSGAQGSNFWIVRPDQLVHQLRVNISCLKLVNKSGDWSSIRDWFGDEEARLIIEGATR